jgi:zinc metalloprotease ZmpB
LDTVCTYSDTISSTLYFSILTNINILNENNAFLIYPNPATDKITIDLNGNNSINLSIYNIVGELLFHKELYKSEIDISFLPKGIYIIKYFGKDLIVQSKLVKN